MARRVALAALVAAVLATAGCTGSGHRSATAKAVVPERLSWVKERVLPGVDPGGITTDPFTATTYVGGSLPAAASSAYSGPLIKGGSRKPVLWERAADGTWSEDAVRVSSFYGAQATLASLSSYRRLTALGAVAGGAHANPRPSFYVTSAVGGVVEHEQYFDVYGGEDAVGIVSVAAGPRGFLMVGQWAPDGHRASGALWTSVDGVRYVRHDAIPGLGDSQGGQVTTSPQAAAFAGGRFVVVGSVTDLTQPKLSIVPAVWLSDGRSVTPGTMATSAGQLGGPTALACVTTTKGAGPPVTGECLTAGLVTVAGREVLAAWRIGVSGQVSGRQLDLSDCPAPAPAPAPGSSTPRAPAVRVSIGPDGQGWVVASTATRGIACRVTGSVARPATLPSGCVPVAVQVVSTDPASNPPALLCADANGVTAYHAG